MSSEQRTRTATGRGLGLRAHLVALSLALMIPAIALGLFVAWHAVAAYRMGGEERLEDTARALALAVDREIGRFEATLLGLASSPLLEAGAAGREDFANRARAIGAALGSWVVVVGPGPEFRPWVVTEASADLPEMRAVVGRVFDTGQPAVGGVAAGGADAGPAAVVVVPVVREGRTLAAVAMKLDPARLRQLLDDQHFTGGSTGSVTDEHGLMVARSREHARMVGRLAPAWYRDAVAGGRTGIQRGPNLDGTDVVLAFAPVPAAPGWAVTVAEPWSEFADTWLGPLRVMALGGATLLTLGMLLAMQVARRLLRPIQALAADARRMAATAHGISPAVPDAQPSGLAEFDELRQGFVAAALALQQRIAAERSSADAARASEAALAESEARFSRAVAAARIGTWEWDAVRDVLSGSPGREALWGVAPNTLVNRDAFLAAIHPDDRAATLAANLRALRGEDGGAYVAEFRVIWPDGGIHWLRNEGRVEFGADGTPLRMSGAVLDITDRKRAQEAFEQLNRELAARVRDEIDRSATANARAVKAERMQALGQLAGGIAHDFNNVLQAVQGSAALIERRPEDADSVRRFARLILDSSGRGASITRRMLAFARQGDLHAEAIDARALLASMRDVLAHALGGAIEVRVEAAAELPALAADKGQLETVLVNLATNARDAMPQGGSLTFAAAAETVTARAEHPARLSPGHYLRLSVADTGTGIDLAVQERIYEPFFTTKAAGKGTGLGLPMAKGFAEQSGGGLMLESRPGQGTVVTLWLPQARNAAPPRSAPAPGGQALDESGVRVLLVDDDELVREALVAELTDGGHAVLAARSGEAALAMLDAGTPVDILVTDLSMPGMDGLAVIRAAQLRRPGLPAVLLTGYAGDGAALAMSGALTGSFSLLRKPASGRQLLDRIAVLLEQATS